MDSPSWEPGRGKEGGALGWVRPDKVRHVGNEEPVVLKAGWD